MQDPIQKQILDAFLVVLRPVVRILLRYGIGFREFAEVIKFAYVDVATSDYGIRGRPTNISRVAVMTGLTRKEVRRVRNLMGDDSHEYVMKLTPLASVLSKWHSTEEFLDSSGLPASLPFAGDGTTFTELVRRFGGDIPPGAMRTELRRIGAIEELDDGSLRAIRRDVKPKADHDNLCMSLVHATYPLMCTIAHNTDPEREGDSWPQMTAYSGCIRDSDTKRLRRICADRVRGSAESFDDLFMAYADPSEEGVVDDHGVPLAVGMFYFEERESDAYAIWKRPR